MSFYRLYRNLYGYQGDETYSDVLTPEMPSARNDMQLLQPSGNLQSTTMHSHNSDASYEWYALSRVNDLLLMNFQPEVPWFDWHQESYIKHYPPFNLEEYQSFFERLGMREEAQATFHPFYHEIVEVEQSQNPTDAPEITRVLWPCLMYGSMLFSRAGVAVRAGLEHSNKGVAEHSKLYFTYARKYRPTHDQSHGWGSNSQWSTDFRRDYVTNDAYHYNVDGMYAEPPQDLAVAPNKQDEEFLSMTELSLASQRELLRHRCFTTTRVQSDDEYPYNAFYIEKKERTTSQ